VLNAQQELVNARVSLVIAQRDRVVGSYAVLAAAGGLSAMVLALPVQIYDPTVHYHRCATPGSACARRTANSVGRSSLGRRLARRPGCGTGNPQAGAFAQDRFRSIKSSRFCQYREMSVIRRTRPGWEPAVRRARGIVRGYRR
jgi:hypothetical protein